MSIETIDETILFDASITSGAYRFFSLLRWYNDLHQTVPGQDEMGTRLGVSGRAIRSYVAELKSAGYITARQMGLGQPTTYTIRSFSDSDRSRAIWEGVFPSPEELDGGSVSGRGRARAGGVSVGKALRLWRREVLNRCGRKCAICGITSQRTGRALHAHHIYPQASHPQQRFDPLNGIPLCRKHHLYVHHAETLIKAKHFDFRDDFRAVMANAVAEANGDRVDVSALLALCQQTEHDTGEDALDEVLGSAA